MSKYLIFCFTTFCFINLNAQGTRPTRSACEEFYLYGRDCSSGCVAPKEVYCRMEYPDIFERGQSSQTPSTPTRIIPVTETSEVKYLDNGSTKDERDVSHYLLANSTLKMSDSLEVFPGDVLKIKHEYAENYFRENADGIIKISDEFGFGIELKDPYKTRRADGKSSKCTLSFKKVSYDPRTVKIPKYVEVENVERKMMTPRLIGGSNRFYSCDIETRLKLKDDIFDYISCTEYGERDALIMNTYGCSFIPTSKKRLNYRLQSWLSL